MGNKVQKQYTKADELIGLVEECLNIPITEGCYNLDVYDRVNYIQNLDGIS